ncbi:MAG: D-aminoacyl-tRNA deacylase [Thermoplasmata archaeon]
MDLLVVSKQDPASSAMGDYLVKKYPFRENNGMLTRDNFVLTYIDKIHLNYDNININADFPDVKIDRVIFLSKHSSSADIKSLTVHATGNYGENKLGGYEKTLSVSDPEMMTQSLRILKQSYRGEKFSVTFESTHHGPYLDVPNYYIEIGTTEEEWQDPEALSAVTEAVMRNHGNNYPNYVGIGGGHYSPKITEYVLENNVNIGHILSKHDHETADESIIRQAVQKTPRCRGFIMDKKGSRSGVREIVRSISEADSLELIVI